MTPRYDRRVSLPRCGHNESSGIDLVVLPGTPCGLVLLGRLHGHLTSIMVVLNALATKRNSWTMLDQPLDAIGFCHGCALCLCPCWVPVVPPGLGHGSTVHVQQDCLALKEEQTQVELHSTPFWFQ